MNPIWIFHFLKSIFHCFSCLHPKLINYLPRGDSWLPKWYERLCKDQVIFACVQWTTSDCGLFGDVTRKLGWFVIVEVDHSVVFIATSQVAFSFNSQFQLTNAAPVSLCLGTQQGLVWIGLWLVTYIKAEGRTLNKTTHYVCIRMLFKKKIKGLKWINQFGK